MEDIKNVTDLVTNRKKVPEIRRMIKKSIEEMTEYCLGLREFKEVITGFIVDVPEKRPEIAKAAVKKGNKFLAVGNNTKAIESYNIGVISGSFKKNTDGKPIDNTLALSYAGRSTASFELAHYQECLRDIERAIEHGYPLILVSKLKERRAKCLIALGKVDEAEKVIDEYLAELDNLKLAGSTAETRASLEKLKSKSNKGCERKNNILQRNNFPGLDIFPTYDIPVLEDPHPKIPSLSSAVDISVSEYKGRYLVAQRDINPGDVISHEPIFASILHEEHFRTNCSNCSIKTSFPVPCPSCDMIVFCSEECRSSALEHFHGVECELLPTISKLKFSSKARLALRVVVKVGLDILRECIPRYSAERLNRHPSKYGFNEDSIYSSNDYRTIYNLVTNKEKKKIHSTLPTCVRAYKLLKLLEKTTFFKAGNPSDDDRKIVFHALLIHLMNAHSNSYRIFQSCIDPTDKVSEQLVSHGIASVYSLLGHSCDSNTSAFHFPSTTVTRALEFITKGSEITLSYLPNYDRQAVTERQDFLDEIFYFKCRCPACSGCWPLKQDPGGFKELEIICKISSHTGTNCPSSCAVSLDREKLKLPELIYTRENGLSRVLSVVKFDINTYKQIITLLCKYASRPCSDLAACKKILRNEYFRIGFRFHSSSP